MQKKDQMSEEKNKTVVKYKKSDSNNTDGKTKQNKNAWMNEPYRDMYCIKTKTYS